MKRPLVLAGLALGASASQAYVLDFGNGPDALPICSDNHEGVGSPLACSNALLVRQNYGDLAGVVDVSCQQPLFSYSRSPRWWGIDYNDLYGVVWADRGDGPSSHARIELKPSGGVTTLTHFDMGACVRTTRGTTVNVFEIGGSTPLFTYAGDVGSGSAHTSFDLSVSWSKGLWFDWQDSAYNVGMDNVTFSVSVVPEPSTCVLTLLGLAACGAAARRRLG
jgi:hypothetical protein